LTYADMITLLVALFMVLFSISSVNKSKWTTLQRTLKEAFGGKVMPGGESIKEAGGPTSSMKVLMPPLAPSFNQVSGRGDGKMSRSQEDDSFRHLKTRIDGYAKQAGLSGRVQTRVTKDGLVIRMLTDKLLFNSGSAQPNPQSLPILHKLAGALGAEGQHPVVVSGHTDRIPIQTTQFPTNWELSAARASAVVRAFAPTVSPQRMTASGRAYLDPITSNDTPAGRELNRRVEILLPRLATEVPVGRSASSTTATEGHP
jgi:chemotaxis protein MotB